MQFWSIGSYDSESIPSQLADIYQRLLPYITNFLCSQHPQRKGLVCPFVPAAIKRDKIYFTHYSNLSDNDVLYKSSINFIRKCVEFYKNNIKNSKEYGALIVLFPADFDIDRLLEIHVLNKKQCVEAHLMIGALWDKNQAQSLHNKNFFPLRTPTPILVIRDLTLQDLIFLDPKHYNIPKTDDFSGRRRALEQ